jgi:hypothetical protein
LEVNKGILTLRHAYSWRRVGRSLYMQECCRYY